MTILKTGDVGRFDEKGQVDSTDELLVLDDKQKLVREKVSTVASTIINPTENVIPVRRNNSFIDSPFTVVYTGDTPTDIVSSVPLTVPSGTVSLGGILQDDGTILRGVTELKDSGESFLASDNITGLDHTIPRTLINDDLNAPFGVGRTTVQDGTTFEWSIFGGSDSDTIELTGDETVTVTFREVLTAYVTGQRFRGTQGKMHYRVIDITANDGIDTLVYTSEQGEPIDFDSAVAPDFQIEYETFNPNFLIQDHLLRLEFFNAEPDVKPLILRGQQDGSPEDPSTFTPFFETLFSVSRERVIFPNDEIQRTDTDFSPDESGTLAVDTSSNPVKITLDPDFNKNLRLFDETGSFDTNNCTVDLEIFNTRTLPNDSIGNTLADAILCDDIDAGASGTKVALNNSGSPVFFNDGTNWHVVTDSETLNFDEVTNRNGLVFFRILGTRAALSVGDQTQLIEGISGNQVEFDTIGDATNPIDSIFHLRTVVDRSFTFDDNIVGITEVVSDKNAERLYYYDQSMNQWYIYDVRQGLLSEAPQDGKQYTRKNGTWDENNSADTIYSPTGNLTATNTQDAIDELESNKVDEAPIDGQSYIRKDGEWIPTEYTSFNDATIYSTNSPVPTNVLNENVTLSEGFYEIGLSYSAGVSTTNRSVLVEFKIDGTPVGFDFDKESKDNSDVHQPCKRISKQLPAGTYNFTVDFSRAGGGGGSVVFISDICLTIERKL